MKKYILGVIAMVYLTVSVHAYEFVSKDFEILGIILQRAKDWIEKKWPHMRDKYLMALRLFQQKHRENERIFAIIQRAIDSLERSWALESKKNVILQMTTLCENAPKTKLQYNYAENIGDGRGITFGIIGFTTGTYDGNMLLKHYTKLNPQNSLKKYIPALDVIDAEKHDASWKNSNTNGLDGFIAAVENNKDPLFKKAQLDLLDIMYWTPAVKITEELSLRYPLSSAFIYDMVVNHGEGWAKSLIRQTNSALGRPPKDGVEEKKWLKVLMNERYEYLKKDFPSGLDRINAFRKLLDADNMTLSSGYVFSVYGGSYKIDGNVF